MSSRRSLRSKGSIQQHQKQKDNENNRNNTQNSRVISLRSRPVRQSSRLSAKANSKIKENTNKVKYESEDSINSEDDSIQTGKNKNKRLSSSTKTKSNKKLKSESIKKEESSNNEEEQEKDECVEVVVYVNKNNNEKNSKKKSKKSSIKSDSIENSSILNDTEELDSIDTVSETNNESTVKNEGEKKKGLFGRKKKEYTGIPPLNLNTIKVQFKNPNYITPRKYKSLKRILAIEKNNTEIPVNAPTYFNIEAPPSLYPKKKYCDVTGLEALYTDPKSGLRYYDSSVYKYIQEQPQHILQGYLSLRNAAVNLK